MSWRKDVIPIRLSGNCTEITDGSRILTRDISQYITKGPTNNNRGEVSNVSNCSRPSEAESEEETEGREAGNEGSDRGGGRHEGRQGGTTEGGA